jgi:phosphatidylserine decarboxylase
MVTPLAPNLVTNNARRQYQPEVAELAIEPPRPVSAGDEIGTFMLGSTVVLVFDEASIQGLRLIETDDNRPIRMGHALCE